MFDVCMRDASQVELYGNARVINDSSGVIADEYFFVYKFMSRTISYPSAQKKKKKKVSTLVVI